MTGLPVTDWLKALEEMATQTAAWLQQVAQAFYQPSESSGRDQTQAADSEVSATHRTFEGINPLREEGKIRFCPTTLTAHQCLSHSLDWEVLLNPVERSVQSADHVAENVHRLGQQWQERYAAWQQLLEQFLKALLSRSPPP